MGEKMDFNCRQSRMQAVKDLPLRVSLTFRSSRKNCARACILKMGFQVPATPLSSLELRKVKNGADLKEVRSMQLKLPQI